ncbi:YraN family protein [Natronohydrobacter thiooxidans]|jgi:putative endonuclease|uniref:YraN family protein n=1 Tax=Natronohydrobacter thiooxidans TaxID=87172 RepID=UPI0008FF23EB|nr:YraN family protein [Natronohydrobacter thiooxidans]
MIAARNYHAGLAAESSVLRQYLDAGYQLLAQRFRGLHGEIDLILRKGAAVIFVEVKKSRSFDAALARLGPAQIGRIFDTAAEFLGTQPLGQLTETRFDVALVNAQGQITVMENALGP